MEKSDWVNVHLILGRMKLLSAFLILLSAQSVLADQPRLRYSFKSANGYFELKPSDTIFSDNRVYTDTIGYSSEMGRYVTYSFTYPDRYYWGLYDLRTGKKLYTIENDSLYIESKTACISDNGEHIIIIDDYSGGFAVSDQKAVYFYLKGEPVKTLTFENLLSNMCSASYSISHLRWCFSFNLLNENSFQIETYEYYTYQFDLNGNLMAKTSDERIKPNDDIVVARIKRLAKNKYSFVIQKSIRNKHELKSELIVIVSDKVMRKVYGKFYGFLPSRNKKMETEFHGTALFREGKPVDTEFGFPIYNAGEYCNLANDR